MRSYGALFLVPLLLATCSSDSPTSQQDVRLELVTVVQYSQSGYESPARSVIRSTGEWSRVWQTLHSGISPGPPIPAVDFGREMLVLAATGTRSNGCYAVEVTRATWKGDSGIEFEVTQTVPGPACICTEAITRPAHVARLGRIRGAARFVERQSVQAC